METRNKPEAKRKIKEEKTLLYTNRELNTHTTTRIRLIFWLIRYRMINDRLSSNRSPCAQNYENHRGEPETCKESTMGFSHAAGHVRCIRHRSSALTAADQTRCTKKRAYAKTLLKAQRILAKRFAGSVMKLGRLIGGRYQMMLFEGY